MTCFPFRSGSNRGAVRRCGLKKRRGSILILVIIFSTISALVVGSSLRLTVFRGRLGHRTHRFNTALNVAEAGAERGLYELSQSSQAYDIEGTVLDRSDIKVGDYLLEIYADSSAADHWWVDSTAYVPSEDDPQFRRTVRLNVTASGSGTSFYEWAIFAHDDVYLDREVRIDSYNSEDGPHPYAVTNEGPYNPDGPGDEVSGLSGTEGNLGGNIDVNFELDDELLIGGTIQTGGDIEVGDSTVTGDLLDNDDTAKLPATYPDADHNAAVSTNNNSAIQFYDSGDPFDLDDDGSVGTLVHTGLSSGVNFGDGEVGPSDATYDLIVIPPGDYYFSSFILEDADVAIRVIPDGEVNIYLDPGDPADYAIYTDRQFMINENTENPDNFHIFVKQGEINFDNNMTMYGTLYAPNSFVYVDQDIEIFGAMVTGGAELDAAVHLHYDTSLGSGGSPGSEVTVISWTEIDPPDDES